jgi:diaminopimelate epimerase
MQLAFQKMQGAGNQILIVDQRNGAGITPSLQVVRQLQDGDPTTRFDQLMWLGPPRSPDATASYRVFNSDGSEVEQCGNGVRCVAVLLARRQGSPATLLFDSPAGPIEARVIAANRAAVNMGPPVFDDAITGRSKISTTAPSLHLSSTTRRLTAPAGTGGSRSCRTCPKPVISTTCSRRTASRKVSRTTVT